VKSDATPDTPNYKLPYNYEENPWAAAQKFIDDNNLAVEELEVVANFIMNSVPKENWLWNTKTELDAPSSESVNKSADKRNETDQTSIELKNFKYLPETNIILFDQVPPMEKLIKKLKVLESNHLVSLNYEKITDLTYLIKILSNFNEISKIPSNQFFPFLDLLRISIAISKVEDVELEKIDELLIKLIELFSSSSPINSNLLLSTTSNFISRFTPKIISTHQKTKQNLVEKYSNFLNFSLTNSMHPNTILACVTLCLNLCVNFNDFKKIVSFEFYSDFLGNLISLFEKTENANFQKNVLENDQIILRIYMCIGTLLFHIESTAENDENTEQSSFLVKSMLISGESFVEFTDNLIKNDKNSKIVEICKEVVSFLDV